MVESPPSAGEHRSAISAPAPCQEVDLGARARLEPSLRRVLNATGVVVRTNVGYTGALGPDTEAILRAHPSNFRAVGFVSDVTIERLCELGVPVIDDVGSGVIADTVELLADEPPVRRSVRAGAAVVCFSGDKLLGGPRVGLIVGRRAQVELCARHPLARGVRIDKLSLAALAATLELYREPDHARRAIPVLSMLGRIQNERLLLDPRTLTDEEVETAVHVLESARSDGPDESAVRSTGGAKEQSSGEGSRIDGTRGSSKA